ncbi:hypothetical protein [Plantactinospora endophytica]|uniref:Uncharacterized protein n=1 Tax=Plantactinospora endophytica TaxID=673535 RepID=A0ABQ4EBA0_9ACTN|nr:hypothetical protein [Plantactinospora endophytica]GIG91547.1 hypothetical protein Pen02_64830 [Plantactinospora endophytica]
MTGRSGPPEPPGRMLTGPRVYRVDWVLGTDRLRGFCFCGTSYDAEDPIELWAWLLAHPDSHGGTGPTEPEPADPPSGTVRDRQPVPA